MADKVEEKMENITLEEKKPKPKAGKKEKADKKKGKGEGSSEPLEVGLHMERSVILSDKIYIFLDQDPFRIG